MIKVGFDKDKGATTNNNEIEHTKNALLSYFGLYSICFDGSLSYDYFITS